MLSLIHLSFTFNIKSPGKGWAPALLCPNHATNEWIPTEACGGICSGVQLRRNTTTTPDHRTDYDDDDV